MMLRTSHAHEEGTDRDWSVSTTAFSGDNGRVQRIHAVRLETKVFADGRASFSPVAGTEFEIEADLVLLAMGFTGPQKGRLLTDLDLNLDARGNIASPLAVGAPAVLALVGAQPDKAQPAPA